ncbi:MAG: hypothetical protein AAF989_12080, partial [Planctomycetota bacterium]
MNINTIKKCMVFGLTCVLIAAFPASSYSETPLPELSKLILGRFPKADRNEDGKLTGAEWAQVQRVILRQYPDADADGDGALAQAEQAALIRKLSGGGASKTKAPKSSPRQLAEWLKRFPESDADGDGKLTGLLTLKDTE